MSAAQAAPAADADASRIAAAVKTCRCGHDRAHPMVSPTPHYSFVGWAAILVGISWEPRRIDFTCRRCDEAFDTLTDPGEIAKVRLFG